MNQTLYRLTVSADTEKGTISLKYGERIIPDIAPVFTLKGKDDISFIRDSKISIRNGYTSKSIIFDTPEGELSLTEQENSPFVEIDWEVCTPKPERLVSVTVLSADITKTYLGRNSENLKFRYSPFDVWGRPGTRPLSGKSSPDDAGDKSGYWFGSVFDKDTGDAFTVCHRFPCRFAEEIKQEGTSLTVKAGVDIPVSQGNAVHSDRMFINFSEPTTKALHRFQSSINNIDRTSGESEDHTGWNSWDYYKLEVTEQDILDNIDFIRKTPWLKERVRYIIIDDGWQTLCGDWEPNEKFPNGMDGLAAKIREAGYVPGMWSAPFFVNTNSGVYRKHPEWGVQYNGEFFSPFRLIGCEPVWGDRGYLDPTHPEVREHIFNMYRRFHSWGYRYFKTDFLTNSIKYTFESDVKNLSVDPSLLKYHNPDVPLLQAHRNCMLAIRSAIGEESFWLGCGTHPASAADLVDASRIGGDINNYYPGILKCAHSTIFNAHYHGRMWLNDPDFAVFRGKDTFIHDKMDIPLEAKKPYSRYEHQSGCPMSGKEAELWATLIIMSGGLVTFSDALPFIDGEAPRIMKTLLEHSGGPASEPLDIASPVPAMLLKKSPTSNLLALFNYEDEENKTFSIDPDICGFVPGTKMTDLWSGEVVDAKHLDRLEVQPHTCALLQYAPAPAEKKAPLEIPIAVSARHVHLDEQTFHSLFGPGASPTLFRDLSQPGQFACAEKVNLIGVRGRIDNVRLLGPLRTSNQIEVSRTDEFKLGIDAPIRSSGDTKGSQPITLEGPCGTVELKEGLICAQRHIHMTPEDAKHFGVKDRDEVSIAIDGGPRDIIYGDVYVRVSPKFKLEMHIDTDEANAAELDQGAEGECIYSDVAGASALLKKR